MKPQIVYASEQEPDNSTIPPRQESSNIKRVKKGASFFVRLVADEAGEE
jgi:hypothetical protein